MKIRCSKQNLLSGINIVAKAVAAKTTKPILECIMFETMPDGLKLTANNLNLGIETVIEATILESGTAAINQKFFFDMIRKMPDSEISVETNDETFKVEISSEHAHYSIPYFSGEDFPAITNVNKENSIQLSQMGLRDVIRQTIFSIADNENSKAMTGEYFEVNENKLTVVSLDGHRISMRKIALKGDNSNVSAIIPGKSLQEISKIIDGNAEEAVTIYFEKAYVMFEFGVTRVVSRLIEGEYFQIMHMLSMDTSLEMKCNRSDFMGMIDRASLLIQESDKKPVILHVKNDNNLYIKLDTNLGSFNDQMEIEKNGGEIIIGFNPSFLMDALRVIDDDKVNLYMKDSKSPCIIKDVEGTFAYIILPININAEAYA